MEPTLEIHALPHPDAKVRRLGFDLTDPYVEQCWSSVLGPSGVAVLRRMPTLWREQEPARVRSAALAATFGMTSGIGEHATFKRTLDRLVHFRFGHWIDEGAALGIYSDVPPLSGNALRRAPEWTKATHERLLGRHLDGIATRRDHGASVADITARLDRLQEPNPARLPPTQALKR